MGGGRKPSASALVPACASGVLQRVQVVPGRGLPATSTLRPPRVPPAGSGRQQRGRTPQQRHAAPCFRSLCSWLLSSPCSLTKRRSPGSSISSRAQAPSQLSCSSCSSRPRFASSWPPGALPGAGLPGAGCSVPRPRPRRLQHWGSAVPWVTCPGVRSCSRTKPFPYTSESILLRFNQDSLYFRCAHCLGPFPGTTWGLALSLPPPLGYLWVRCPPSFCSLSLSRCPGPFLPAAGPGPGALPRGSAGTCGPVPAVALPPAASLGRSASFSSLVRV